MTLRASLARLWLVALAFVALTLVASAVVGIPVRDPGGEFFGTRIALSGAVFAGLWLLEVLLRRRRRLVPAHRWTRSRLAAAGAALLAYHLVYLGYHNLKSWNDLRTPQDAALTRVDEALFLSHSPAVLLHDLLGQGVAAPLLTGLYESFGTLVVVSVVACLFVPRIQDGVTSLAAMVWVWVLGTACYYLVPSLGPFHARPQDFVGLPASIVSETQEHYLAQRDALLAHPHAPDAFAQIGAFASLHVGVTTVITLMAARLGHPRLARVLGVFLALTCVATVYLGWHFFIDVPAGLLIGWLAVRLSAVTRSAPAGRAAAYPSGSQVCDRFADPQSSRD